MAVEVAAELEHEVEGGRRAAGEGGEAGDVRQEFRHGRGEVRARDGVAGVASCSRCRSKLTIADFAVELGVERDGQDSGCAFMAFAIEGGRSAWR